MGDTIARNKKYAAETKITLDYFNAKEHFEELHKSYDYSGLSKDKKEERMRANEFDYKLEKAQAYSNLIFTKMKQDFTDNYIKYIKESEIVGITQLILYSLGYSQTDYLKTYVDLARYGSKQPQAIKPLIDKICMSINTGEITAFNKDLQVVNQVSNKNLEELEDIQLTNKDAFKWINQLEGKEPETAKDDKKEAVKEIKAKANAKSLDDDISLREEANCQMLLAVLFKLLLDGWMPKHKGNKSAILKKITDDFDSVNGIKESSVKMRLNDSIKALESTKSIPEEVNRRMYYTIMGALYSHLLKQSAPKNINGQHSVINLTFKALPKTTGKEENLIKSIINTSIGEFNKYIEHDQKTLESCAKI